MQATEILSTITAGEFAFGIAKITNGYSVALFDVDLDMFISEVFPTRIFPTLAEAHDFAWDKAATVAAGYEPAAL